MAKLTFGKFSGVDTMELAAGGDTGRDYLEWGAENLKSPKWRQLFDEALVANVAYDMEAEARLIVRDQGDISFDEAMHQLRMMNEWEEETDHALAAYEEWKEEYRAALVEIEVAHPRVVSELLEGGDISDLESLGVQFSSPQRRAEVAALIEEFRKREREISFF